MWEHVGEDEDLCPGYRWNFTPSPGWTVEESATLRLLLMDIGIGRWVQILGTGLLPGKLIQQLYGATQRLLGQQSLAAFTGLCLDVDRIRAENEARADAPRKSGLIIYDGREWWTGLALGWQAVNEAPVSMRALLTSYHADQPTISTETQPRMPPPCLCSAVDAGGEGCLARGSKGKVRCRWGGLGLLRFAVGLLESARVPGSCIAVHGLCPALTHPNLMVPASIQVQSHEGAGGRDSRRRAAAAGVPAAGAPTMADTPLTR